MQTKITINEVEFDIYFNQTQYVPATWDDPAYGGEVEIEVIQLDGNDVTELLSQWVFDKILDELTETDWLKEEKDQAMQDEAERREDNRRLFKD